MLLLNALPGGQIGPWRADIPGVTDGCVGWEKDQTNADDWCEFSPLHVGIIIEKCYSLALCFAHTYLPLISTSTMVRTRSDQHGSCRE